VTDVTLRNGIHFYTEKCFKTGLIRCLEINLAWCFMGCFCYQIIVICTLSKIFPTIFFHKFKYWLSIAASPLWCFFALIMSNSTLKANITDLYFFLGLNWKFITIFWKYIKKIKVELKSLWRKLAD